MHIIIRASEDQKQVWLSKPAATGGHVEFAGSDTDLYAIAADIYFDLIPFENNLPFTKTDKPVFINAVTERLNIFPANYIRINAWNSFFQRTAIEIAVSGENKNIVKNVMHVLGWQYVVVQDITGMITARTVSMIINEAYFALGEKVSSKKDIDTAMKLGTNYPFGPFEWGEIIGLRNIYKLLKQLGKEDSRYVIAPLLEQEFSTGRH